MVFVWALLAIIVFLVALLAVPLEWTFNVRQEAGERTSNSHIRWLFGLVRISTKGSPEAKTKPKKPKQSKKEKKPKAKRRHSPLAAVSVEGFVGRVLGLIRKLLSAIHIHHLNLNARLGLGDAADTGRMWGFIGPLSVLLNQPKATRIYIEPEFYDEVFDAQADGRIQVVPLRLVGLILGFLLSLNTLRAYRAMRAGGQ